MALATTSEVSKADTSALERHIQAGGDKAEQGDCRGSLKHLDAALGDKDFPDLPEVGQGAVYLVAAVCALEVDKQDEAYSYALGGTSRPAASESLWRIRLGIELTEKRDAQAVETIEAIASRSPGGLNAMPIRWFYQLDLRARSNPALQRRLLRVLSAADYRPQDVATSTDDFKRGYAAILADSGDTAGALAMARSIESPATLLLVSVDPRLRAALPAEFDGQAEVERSLTKARETAANHPESIFAVVQVARYQRMLGRPEDSLATLVAARLDGPQGAAFTDEHRNWWWDAFARTYEMLGRYDEAVDAFHAGMAGQEYGQSNVSQALNLSYTQLRFGRPAEALSTLSALEKGKYRASPYGKMVMHMAQGCSRIGVGQTAAAKADLDYAAAHEGDHQEALMNLQLCAGDLEGAAGTVIRRLDDPERRSAALLQLSEFDPPPATLPPTPAELRLPELKARPDVQAAIARAGGVRRYRLQGSEF